MKTIVTIVGLLSLLASVASARVRGPYTNESHTLHLYHFDEASGAIQDTGSGTVTNLGDVLATYGNTSSTGFGSSLYVIPNGYHAAADANAGRAATSSTNIQTLFQGADGSFTFEALLKVGNIQSNQVFLSHDTGTAGYRGWYVRLLGGNLQFYDGTVLYSCALPTSGPLAFDSNQWFHAAVTYNGQENTDDNLKLYWTPVRADAREASLLAAFKKTNDLANVYAKFGVGSYASSSGYFLEPMGAVDEVRISDVARGPGEFIFERLPADFSTWGKLMPFTFPGYSRAETLTNFPVMLVLSTNIAGFSYADFLSATNADLRFTDSTLTNELNYEVDEWNTNGSSYVWVQVPRLTNNATVWAFWNKTSQSIPTYTGDGATWSAGYLSVHHMGRSGTSIDLRNSARAQNPLTNGGGASNTPSGFIGNGVKFNGVTNDNHYLTVPLYAGFPTAPRPFTLSAWVNMSVTNNGWRTVLGVADTNAPPTRQVTIRDNGSLRLISDNYDGTADIVVASTATYVTGQWYYVAMPYDGTKEYLNIDGVPQNGGVGSNTVVNYGANVELDIARMYSSRGTPPGALTVKCLQDEVRVSTVARGTNWLWAEWMNMASNSAFVTTTGVQVPVLPAVQNGGVTNITFTGADVYGTLSSTGTADTAVFVYWGPTDGGTNAGAWAHTNVFASPQGLGTLSTNLAFGTSNITYYFRFGAMNSNGTTWATASMSFVAGRVTVTATDPTAAETGSDPGTFTVYRPVDATNEALTVSYVVSGTASPGTDYAALSGSVVIPAGSNSATVTVTPVQDALFEPAETVVLTLTNGLYVMDATCADTVTIAADAAATWAKQARITFSGYTKSEALTNFPALVVLSTNIPGFSYGQFLSGTNSDLRFADSNQANELSYEVDTWNTNGPSYVWVRVPVLAGTNTSIWAYWGKSGLSMPSCTTNGDVWTNGFKGVWHLNEAVVDEATGGTNHFDSTANHLNGIQYGNSWTNGVIGGGQDFFTNPPSDSISFPGVTWTPARFSVSFWIKPRALVDWNQGITAANGWGAFTCHSEAAGGLYVGTDAGTRFAPGDTAGAYTVNTWSYITFTYDSGTAAIYKGGTLLKSKTGMTAPVAWTGFNLSGSLHGAVDEVRLCSVARSSNWVWACWMTQVSNSTFEVFDAGVPSATTQPGSNVMETSAAFNGALTSTGRYDTAVLVYWGETNGGTEARAWANANTWPAPQTPGAFTTNLALTPGKEYFYRFAASNSGGLAWAPTTAYLMTTNLTVSVAPASIGENTATGVFTIARPGALTGGTVTASFTIGGTASNGFDYSLNAGSNVTLAAGVASTTVQAVSWSDFLTEPDETVILTLGAGLYVTNAQSTATLTITNIPGATTNSARWVGAAGPNNWSVGANWLGGLPPANNGAAAIRFDQVDAGGQTLLDPENLPSATNAWRIGTYTVANSLAGGGPKVDFVHTNNLNGNRLIFEGDLTFVNGGSQSDSWARAVFTNGTVQIGTTSTPRNIYIGNYGGSSGIGGSYGELRLASGTMFEPHLNDIIMGLGNASGGILDLRGATVVGGVLEVRDLRFCLTGNGGWPMRDMQLKLDNTTQMTELKVRRLFGLGEGASCQNHVSRIGDPNNGWQLPTNVSLTVGSPASRGSILFCQDTWPGVQTYVIAAGGGVFTAYLTDFRIGNGGWGGATAYATLNLSRMQSCVLDCTNALWIPGNNLDASGIYHVDVRFPPGTVTAPSLNVGTINNGSADALLELNGTVCTFSNTVSIGNRGTLRTLVGGTNAGLSLSAGAALSVTSPGKLDIRFTADQAPDQTGTYWGFRWGGDRQATLAAMRTAGTLVWTNTANTNKSISIYYDTGNDMTYVALMGAAPPLAIPRNLTVELAPPSYTNVVIDVNDIDAGSYDPSGLALTNRTLSCAANLTPAQPYLTLDTVGAYTVWLTVVNSNGVAASNSCTLTVTNTQPGTAANLTWDGGAVMTRMPRSEWFWAANWVGDVPPTNPTTATLTFADLAVGTNAIGGDRTIGGLSVQNTTGRHVFNLSSQRLIIGSSGLTVNPTVGNTASSALFTNGTLQIGTAAVAAGVTIGSGSSYYYDGTLTVAPGTTLESYMGTLLMGNGDGGRGYFDLRGAILAGGVLRMNSLRMEIAGNGARWQRYQYIYLNSNTVINALQCTGAFDMGEGEQGTCRIGDPNHGWMLPPNVDLTIGTTGTPAQVILCNNGNGNDSQLLASSGGVFRGYLSLLSVGNAAYPGGALTAIIDLSAMNSATVSVAGAVSIPNGADNTCGYTAWLKLPGGTVTAKDVSVGVPSKAGAVGLLQLSATQFRATNSVTVGVRGTITNSVSGLSGGLDLSSNATLTVSTGGKVVVSFKARCQDASRIYWGLRWAGDHVAALQTMQGDGRLVIDYSALGASSASVFSGLGYTYVGYVPRGSVFTMR